MAAGEALARPVTEEVLGTSSRGEFKAQFSVFYGRTQAPGSSLYSRWNGGSHEAGIVLTAERGVNLHPVGPGANWRVWAGREGVAESWA